jgi:site-specific DNA-methyltransferase (adenine-specific)
MERGDEVREVRDGDFGYQKDGKRWDGTQIIREPATDAAKQWSGYGTTTKPAYEPLVVTRKPLDGTVASNVLAHGCGALNIDGARIGTSENLNGGAYAKNGTDRHDGDENWRYKRDGGAGEFKQPSGRFPANLALVHDEECVLVGTVKVKASAPASGPTLTGPSTSASRGAFKGVAATAHHGDADGTETVDEWRCTDTCAVRVLGEQSGELKSDVYATKDRDNNSMFAGGNVFTHKGYKAESGTAARFFYQGKASANDRLAYLTCSPTCTANDTVAPVKNVTGKVCPVCNAPRTDYQHPTVKPYELALYHAKLLSLPPHTSPVAIVPFCGTGVEARALLDVGYRVIAVDIDPRHVAMTRYRLSGEQPVREAPVTVAQESTPITLDDLFGF